MNKKQSIDTEKDDLQRMILDQILQYAIPKDFDKNYLMLQDLHITTTFLIRKIEREIEKEDKGDANKNKTIVLNNIRSSYFGLETMLGIIMNQLLTSKFRIDVISKDSKTNARLDDDIIIDDYEEIANKYHGRIKKQIINDDDIVIKLGATRGEDTVINVGITNNHPTTIISIGKKIDKKRMQREIGNDPDDNELIYYKTSDIGKHTFVLPYEIRGILSIVLHDDGDLSIDGMSKYSMIDEIGEMSYEKFRAWIFWYICKNNDNNIDIKNPNEEILAKNIKENRIKENNKIIKKSDTKIKVQDYIKPVENEDNIIEQVLELSQKISKYIYDKSNTKIKIDSIYRIANKSYDTRNFDFERYEKDYKIEINEETRVEIKKRANENGREGSYIEKTNEGYDKNDANDREDDDALEVIYSTEDKLPMPEDITGRVKFLKSNNIYILKSNKDKINKFLIKSEINNKKYIGITSKSLYQKIISGNKIIKKNKHDKPRRSIEISRGGRRIMSMVDGKFLVVDVCSYNDEYRRKRYQKFNDNPNYNKDDILDEE